MFYFLSLYVQNVMGYSPLKTGFAFLPFAIGMVFGATLSSKLLSHIDPRILSGTGTILAGIALFGFSRMDYGDVSYWTDIAPYIVLMAVGMGLTFVPMTLAAVHGVKHEDAGIGSGVLNTMQQVGGALGLATLSAVASHYATEKTGELIASGTAGPDAGLIAFAEGATHAFVVGAFMIWTASVVIWTLLNIKHEELGGDLPEGMHVG
jgi:predicted MFS family arabinose efflux permease